jgi:hypothetical protein
MCLQLFLAHFALASSSLEKLIGVACQLVVQHHEQEGVIYANVIAILRPKGQGLAPSGRYVRMKDRHDRDTPAKFRDALHTNGVPEIVEEEVPF